MKVTIIKKVKQNLPGFLLNFLLYIPLLSLASLYFYVILFMYAAGTTQIWEIDPKLTSVGYLHGVFAAIVVVGVVLGIACNMVLLAMDIFTFEGKLFKQSAKNVYLITVILAILIRAYNPGGYLLWFFD